MRYLLAVGLLSLAANAVNAMTVTVEPRGPRGGAVIRMTGMVAVGDSQALRRALEQVKASAPVTEGTLATVELSSSGGDVFEGIALGYLLREFAVGTLVRASDLCLSACALAFLGGSAIGPNGTLVPWRNIELGGQVGFHNVSLNPQGLRNAATEEGSRAATAGFEVARAGASALVRYADDMGIGAGFVSRLLGRPTDQFDYVSTVANLLELHACLAQPMQERSAPEQQAANICSNAAGGEARGDNVRSMAAFDVRLALLREVERHGRFVTTKSRFGERFSAVVAQQDDRALMDLYDGMRAAGLPLPDLSGDLYRVGVAPARSRLSCIVSLPQRQPDDFDVVMLGPKGLSDPLQGVPERCRWLMRHRPEEVVNPPRQAAVPSLMMPSLTSPSARKP